MTTLPHILLLGATLVSPGFAAPSQIDGMWRSEGYGYVFQINGPELIEFEITSNTCVQGFRAARQDLSVLGRNATFKSKDEGEFFIRTGGTVDRKFLHQDEAVSDIRIDRISALPAVCVHRSENTPISNFEVFTRTWAEQYISFEARGINWNRVVDEYRPKITSQTTPKQLFDIFVSMIKPLGDLHIGISAPGLKRSTEDYFRPGTDRILKNDMHHFDKRGRNALFDITNRAYLHGPIRMFCRKQLQYGHIDENTGYLRFLSFGGYARHNDLKALESALDIIFSDSKMHALIIDTRLSFGGSDELGLAIARRLALNPYIAYNVQARSDPTNPNQFTSAFPILIELSSRPGFHGPVIELAGPITMSAAETFSQALMGRTPHITRIGENTQGVFCDVLDRHLPNGWTFGLPNAVYRTKDGIAFDVRGIPPDIEVPVFADSDVAAQKDPAMEKAIQLLSRKN